MEEGGRHKPDAMSGARSAAVRQEQPSSQDAAGDEDICVVQGGARARQEQETLPQRQKECRQEWPGPPPAVASGTIEANSPGELHVDHVKMQERPLMAAFERKNTMRKEEYHHKLFTVVQNLEEKFTKVEEDFFETKVKMRKLKW